MWTLPLSMLSPAGRTARLSILIFHRVVPESDPLFPMELEAAHFERLCAWVASMFHVLPLDEAIARHALGDLPARALSITFDDGYADNHDVAMPILQRHGLSATFFVATGFLDGGRMWNDTVIESIRGTANEALDLRPLAIDGLGVLPVQGFPQRRAAIDLVIGRVKHLHPTERLELVNMLAELSGATLPNNLMMASSQVKGLRQGGMQIGAHTVSHPILASLSVDEARAEIAQSRDVLEGLLAERVPLFAYPNGKPGQDYNADSVRLARELGFDAAVTTAWGAARFGEDVFQLPRFSPWDRRRSRFALRMMKNLWST
jgi:peptidoglycan/xylan/chitin deacetylase (PgdA/CDA1 family)